RQVVIPSMQTANNLKPRPNLTNEMGNALIRSAPSIVYYPLAIECRVAHRVEPESKPDTWIFLDDVKNAFTLDDRNSIVVHGDDAVIHFTRQQDAEVTDIAGN